jgi:hypothetical protein
MDFRIKAKNAAKLSTTKGGIEIRKASAKATVLRRALQKTTKRQELLREVGKFTIEIDRALLRKHVKQLYNNLKRLEALVLA